jgi:hypothetical protein
MAKCLSGIFTFPAIRCRVSPLPANRSSWDWASRASSLVALRQALALSTFKIIWKSDYVKTPHQPRDTSLAKTLGSPRHKALIDLLIQKRETAGLTQADLAERLGEYQSFVARLESGERRVDVVEFLELAEVLGFDAAKAIARLKKVS